MTHDEGVAVFAAAYVYGRERTRWERFTHPETQGEAVARRELARACGLPAEWGDSDEAMAALGVAQVNALYPVGEEVAG